jgi:hypothetical protein
MIRKNRNSETVEEFVEGAVPVQRIIWGTEPLRAAPREQDLPSHGPVVLLDITNHTQVNITDLARLYKTDTQGGEGPTEYAWDYWNDPGNFLVRLILAYTSPVRVEFHVVFRCSDPEHWTFLRWITEHEGMVVLADEYAGPIPAEYVETPRNMLLIISENPGDLESPTPVAHTPSPASLPGTRPHGRSPTIIRGLEEASTRLWTDHSLTIPGQLLHFVSALLPFAQWRPDPVVSNIPISDNHGSLNTLLKAWKAWKTEEA